MHKALKLLLVSITVADAERPVRVSDDAKCSPAAWSYGSWCNAQHTQDGLDPIQHAFVMKTFDAKQNHCGGGALQIRWYAKVQLLRVTE